MNILDTLDDPNLFAGWFHKPESWRAWRVFLAALFGLQMSDAELKLYRQCTGRQSPPTEPASEAWLIVGRRGGKSFNLALVAAYLSCFRDYRPHLAPGERATVLVIAADRKQARTIMRYLRALLLKVPMLARMVVRETADAFDLNNAVSIEVAAASFRTVRGYTLAAALLDEIAFWPSDDAAEPDHEIVAALLPGLATVPGSLLLACSSPHARRGALWSAHRQHFGRDSGPVLVWTAPTTTMNPTVPQRIIDAALAADPAKAGAEWLAEFRSDVETFIKRESVEACVELGCRERGPLSNVRYTAFVDPSGGAHDSMTLAISHREGDATILDAVREVRPPFSPDAVVTEFCALLKSYRVSAVSGDRYAGEWPREKFRENGVRYDVGAKPKSDLYRDLLPLLNSARAVLLDDDRLVNQLIGLERRTARGGRDSIDHAPGGHDDVANAVAGALVGPATSTYVSDLSWVIGPNEGGRFTNGDRLFGLH